jgi:hypothetical protein
MKRWPNFFIVGAPKAGTTSLYEYLKDVPGIYMSPVKEPSYFSYIKRIEKPSKTKEIKSSDEYLKLFDGAKEEKILGEASPLYLSFPGVAQEIYNNVPNAKILISLRDPIERLFSSYLMHYRLGNFQVSFHDQINEAINAKEGSVWKHGWLERSFYFKDVKKYLDIFGTKQVKIIIFEEWIKNPIDTINKILNFLEINYTVTSFEEETYNPFVVARGSVAKYIFQNRKLMDFAQKHIPSSTRRILKNKVLSKKQEKPKMEERDKKILINFYKDDVRKLENLLGTKLPWKNFTAN